MNLNLVLSEIITDICTSNNDHEYNLYKYDASYDDVEQSAGLAIGIFHI